jgi:hypothetical protein
MPDWCKWLAERAARFRRFPAPARPYLLEAMFYLLVARLALRVIPFRRLTWFFERPPRRPQDTFAERQRIGAAARMPFTARQDEITGTERERFRKGVQWLINEAAWFLPGETVCFPRAIVAQAILRRLGMAATLYYGAATLPERGLTAHAWVQDGSQVIVGRSDGQDYHILARYPEGEKPVFLEKTGF